MKITKTKTMPVVVSGDINGAIIATRVFNAPGSGCLTSTGIGLLSADGCRIALAGGLPASVF
jgi:hypothetical protein